MGTYVHVYTTKSDSEYMHYNNTAEWVIIPYTFQLEVAECSVGVGHNSVGASVDTERVAVQCLDKFSLLILL